MLVTLQRNRILLTLVASAVFLFLFALPVFAQQDFGFTQAAEIGGGAFGTSDLRQIIVNIVNIALGFLGIIAVIIIIYGGWLWMTSGGNPEKLDRAKKTLVNAAIGFLVIISSYAIIAFFTRGTILSTGGGGGIPIVVSLGNGALGAGIVESVYPPHGARGVARNSSIFVTFKEPMDPCTLIAGPAPCDSGNLAFRSGGSALVPEDMNLRIIDIDDTDVVFASADVNVATNDNNTVFTFDPVGFMGSPFESQAHYVQLTNDITKANGDSAFPGAVSGIGFQWGFNVSNIIDVTPPRLVGFLPFPLSTNPRNVIISMRFSEAINPISIDSDNIQMQIPAIPGTVFGAGGACTANKDCTSGNCDTVASSCVGDFIVGTLFQASDYRTVEFLPNSECEGQPLNTCGEPVFCFPADSQINSLVIADALVTPVIDGVQDAAANSFDGDGDGIAEGPNAPPGGADYDLGTRTGDGDNAFWDFFTNNTIDLTPPAILERNPGPTTVVDGPGFHPNLFQELMIKFDKHLAISTLRPDGSYGDGKEYLTLLDPTQQVGYMTFGTNGNGCSFECLNEGSNSVFGSTCGNNNPDPGEDCDDGNTVSGDGCSANCLHEGTGTCGDGFISHGEQCDDGGTAPGDGCSAICQNEGLGACVIFSGTDCCGNGQVEVGESCDNTSDPGCGVTCLRIGNPLPFNDPAGYCGNGIIEPDLGEECDDGSGVAAGVSGDGCSNECIKEGSACGNGQVDPGEDCDDGGASCSNACLNLGSGFLLCGNNNPNDPGEDCDLGPVLNESFAFINHTGLAESQQYGIRVGSGIRDLYQNCFLPSAESDESTYFNCRTEPGNTSFGWVEDPTTRPWPSAGTFPNCLLP